LKNPVEYREDSRQKYANRIPANRLVVICLFLVIAIAAVYAQVLDHPFANIDDKAYVVNNPNVSNGITPKSMIWAFTSSHSANWHPVTWISHMLDVQFYGMNPRGHHFTNLLIHTISSLLLLLLLSRMTGSLWRSAFVAGMFALHPLHVESVAWIAERKDVLSGLFCFITLLLYFEYVKTAKPALYMVSLLSFIIGLMSKPMLVTLPFVMLLLDAWPLDRFRHDPAENRPGLPGNILAQLVREKIPFIICTLASCVITWYAQLKEGAVSTLQVISLGNRVENAALSYVKYIFKTFLPLDLAVYYPLPASFPLWQVAASLLLLVILSALAVRSRHAYPYVAVGWAWYLLTLVPVIGIVQVGNQSMADRYMYIPMTGLCIMLAWGVPDLAKKIRYGTVITAMLAGLAIGASSIAAWRQLGYWRDETTLFSHALHVTTDNWFAHNAFGLSLANKGDTDAAINEFRESLRIYPFSAETHINLGMALALNRHLDEAIGEFRTALSIDPKSSEGYKYLGSALLIEGYADGAVQALRKAVECGPDQEDAHFRLGQALARTGDTRAAIGEFQAAVRIDPGSAPLHKALALALAGSGDITSAIREFRNSLAIDPNDAETHNNLGFALAGTGDKGAAIQEYLIALRLNPDSLQIRRNLEAALAGK